MPRRASCYDAPMPPPFTVTFSAGNTGPWRIERLSTVTGQGLPIATHLAMMDIPEATWRLRGVVSNPRYSTAAELKELAGVQAGLGRAEATCAALIPIRKSEAWWSMAQDERRAVFEDRSRHIALSMKYLPAVARRLHHAVTSVSPSTSSPGSSSRPSTRRRSTRCWPNFARASNGPTWSAKSRSGLGASTDPDAPPRGLLGTRSSAPAIRPA